MDKKSTNVELNNGIIVNVGEVIADPERGETKIPPNNSGSKESPEKEEVVTIKLSGKWPPEKTTLKRSNKNDDKDKKEGPEGRE